MDAIQKELLEAVSGLHEIPAGAYNIRANGESVERKSTEHIEIVSKEDKSGIEIHIKPGTKNESVHMPVILSKSGLEEVVYNDFYIGEGADVTIVAGCGIHNGGGCGKPPRRHPPVLCGKKCAHKVRGKALWQRRRQRPADHESPYGDLSEEDSFMEMDTVQIRGVDSTNRGNKAHLAAGSRLVVMERLMTHGQQRAESHFDVQLDGEDCSANVVSRSVAKGRFLPAFVSHICGNNRCSGHTECDAIIMDNAKISAVPELTANHLDAALIHEAAIGKNRRRTDRKLMTLGLTEAEAEEQIISGFPQVEKAYV